MIKEKLSIMSHHSTVKGNKRRLLANLAPISVIAAMVATATPAFANDLLSLMPTQTSPLASAPTPVATSFSNAEIQLVAPAQMSAKTPSGGLLLAPRAVENKMPVTHQAAVQNIEATPQFVPPAHTQNSGQIVSTLKDASMTSPTVVETAYADVDMAALYYYAKERNHQRVDAEIKRLQTIHAGFMPPADLYVDAQKQVTNEQSLWDLFAVDDFTGIDAEIIRRKTENPNWVPTADFANKLARKKQRIQMIELAKSKDWVGVISVGQSVNPATETDIDLVWTMIDAYAHLNRRSELVAAYRGLLFRENVNRLSDAHLMITLEKSVRDFSSIEVRRVITSLWPVPGQIQGMDKLHLALIRKAIGEYNLTGISIAERNFIAERNINVQPVRNLRRHADAELCHAGDVNNGDLKNKADAFKSFDDHYRNIGQNMPREFGDARYTNIGYTNTYAQQPSGFAEEVIRRVPHADVQLLSDLTIRTGDHSDAALLGWYNLCIERPASAQPFFELALDKAPNQDNAKGLYLSLIRQNHNSAAMKFVSKNLELLGNDPTFLMNVLAQSFASGKKNAVSEASLRAYSEAILETKSASHAEILGWYAYNSRQFEAAQAWFGQSWNWEENEDRLKGLALAKIRLGLTSDYKSLRAQYEDEYPGIWPEVVNAKPPKKRRAVSVARPKKNVKVSYLKHFERKDYASCLRDLDRASAKGLSADAWLIRGWCYLAMSRMTEAEKSFAAAMNSSGKTRADAVYGRALALLRIRMTDDAEALVQSNPLSANRQKELRTEIYYQRAKSAFDHQQYARALSALDARAKITPEPRDLAMMRAWAYHHLGYSRQANIIFKRLNMHIQAKTAAHGVVVTQ